MSVWGRNIPENRLEDSRDELYFVLGFPFLMLFSRETKKEPAVLAIESWFPPPQLLRTVNHSIATWRDLINRNLETLH